MENALRTSLRPGRDLTFFTGAVLLLLPSIWSPCSITGQDEYYLSFRTVLEMQERGEWLTPYVNEQVRLQKPPLLYWLMRASFLVFGPNLFAARIWTVLFGAGMALYTAKLARRCPLSGHDAGYLAGLFVLGAAGVMIDARRAMFDLPVGCLCTVAIYHAVKWRSEGRARDALLAGAALAAASMTKGPIALWFCAAPCVAGLVSRRERAAGAWWHWVASLVAFVALALPWPLWVQEAHPRFWEVMNEQAASREFGLPPASRPLQLLGAALGLAVPWSATVVAGAVAAARKRGTAPTTARWLLLWILLGVLPFVFMRTFERYLIALVCPMAMLAASWVGAASPSWQRVHATIAVALTGVPVLVFSLFTVWFGLAYVTPIATIALLASTWRHARQSKLGMLGIAARCAALLSLLLGFVYPAVGINKLPDNLPYDFTTASVRTFGRPQPGMLSMQLGRSVQVLDSRSKGLAARLASYSGYVVALSSDVPRIKRAAAEGHVRLEEVLEFRSFYSRKTWLKFFKTGLEWPDWRDAVLARSPEKLQPSFTCLRCN